MVFNAFLFGITLSALVYIAVFIILNMSNSIKRTEKYKNIKPGEIFRIDGRRAKKLSDKQFMFTWTAEIVPWQYDDNMKLDILERYTNENR